MLQNVLKRIKGFRLLQRQQVRAVSDPLECLRVADR